MPNSPKPTVIASPESTESQPNSGLVLCILDGWGHRKPCADNAVTLANPQEYNILARQNPSTLLRTDGAFVGLPERQPGNSEVGHLHLGLGLVAPQALTQIGKAFDQSQQKNLPSVLKESLEKVSANQGSVHLVGLLSEGGVHSHRQHLASVATLVGNSGIPCFLHAITDGRDEPPGRSMNHLRWWQTQVPHVPVATAIGRYYAMDRDNNTARTQKALDLMQSPANPSAGTFISFYDLDKKMAHTLNRHGSEEFLEPLAQEGHCGINSRRDLVVHMNFRPDRARQLIQGLEKTGADVLTTYRMSRHQRGPFLFHRPNLPPSLGEILARSGKRQFRIAETEKYAHVTYFFSAYQEDPFENEQRMLIPSPKVQTFDQNPHMSAAAVTDELCAAIERRCADFYLVNYANPDMLGHTGKLDATIDAITHVDKQLQRLENVCKKQGVLLLIVSDHGNAEEMLTAENIPHTSHTLSPVLAIGVGFSRCDVKAGGPYVPSLIDVAPTVLQALGLKVPPYMTGRPLFR